MATSVTIKLTIGIPSEAVYYKLVLGGAYNGGIKCSPNPTLNLDEAGAASLSVPALGWETSHSYADEDALAVPGKPDWYRSLRPGANPTGTATLQRTSENLNVEFAQMEGATHAVLFTVAGPNPLLVGAPAIDAVITVGLRKVAGGVQFAVKGDHDGFPNYTLQINGKTMYVWDAVAQGGTPLALSPPMDQSVNIGWTDL